VIVPGSRSAKRSIQERQTSLSQDKKKRVAEPASALTRGAPPENVSLEGVLRSLGVSAGQAQLPVLPGVGEEVFGFHLGHELGRGAFGCVFLAEQANLARRAVVLKVSGIEGSEPETLAQLQHTHIVPIHSVHEDAVRGLRAVCMPYFGGASLSRVLQVLWKEDSRPKQGKSLLRALKAVQGPLPHALVTAGHNRPATPRAHLPEESVGAGPAADSGGWTAWDLLEGLDYIRASAWIVARLAEGLHHAHERGVLHRDIKPSNILLSADGQPMLLDFNLSQNLQSAAAQATAAIGGTVAYMSPEHLQALASRDPALVRQVARPADIYSLGMVLYEMLAGCSPFDHSGSYSVLPLLIQTMAVERSCTRPSLRQHRSDVPWSLDSIGRKCLDPDPSKRYQRAEHLAEDLRCFLDDRPLKYAPELSRVERVRKWVRRHPGLTSSSSVAATFVLLLVALGGSTLAIQGHLAKTRAQLLVVQAQDRLRAYVEGARRALCLVNTTTDLHDHLREGLAVCEKTLALYGILEPDPWRQPPDWHHLEADDRQQVAATTRELLLMLAWARARIAAGNKAGLKDSLSLLDRAEAIEALAPSQALYEDRALYLRQLGDEAGASAARTQAQQLRPTSASDHYLLATTYARNRRYAEAVEELEHALRLNPRHYWSVFQRGICHLEMGKPALAAGDFGVCIGLWPEFAWGHFNRGAALNKLGEKARAIADYTAALECDPGFFLAYLNRGIAYLELQTYEQARTDLQRALDLGGSSASLHAGLGVALEKLGKTGEADAAFHQALELADQASADAWIGVRCAYAFAVAGRLPGKAEEIFTEILRQRPDNPQALYGRAMLLVERGSEKAALGLFDRALDAAPDFLEARRFRAVLLARGGDFEAAAKDMNWCLAKGPGDGATLYAAACVAARAAEKASSGSPAQSAADQAIAFLRKALASGYGQTKIASDPDLGAIRHRPEMQSLLKTKDN
jgi:serine/threonine protein kinase/tetratricopeptide (TPR) repeat protein